MRYRSSWLGLMAVLSLSACDLWPKGLDALAESITKQVSGATTAWLLNGDVVVINVAGSPSYLIPQAELQTLATGIAEQTINHSAEPLESISITFHESEVSENSMKMREFIFLVLDNRPVLQPYLDLDATGPLTTDEIEAAVDRLDQVYDQLEKPLTQEYRKCVLAEVEKRAQDAGDPETLNPASLEFLPGGSWYDLDGYSKRILLTQAIMSKALFICVDTREAEVNS